MSNERLEKLMNVNAVIALIFAMIIKGKVGLLGFAIFGIITMIIGGICIRRGIHKKPEIVEVVFVLGGLVITVIMGYLRVFKTIKNKFIILIIIVFYLVWLFGGLLILYIRKRRRER